MRRTMSMLGLAAALLLGAVGAAPAGAETSAPLKLNYRAEADAFNITRVARVYHESSATGGKAVVIEHTGAIWRWMTTPSAQQVALRVKGRQCDGAPRLRVTIDGVVVLEAAVTSQSWMEVSATVPITAATHAVALTFTNDHAVPGRCDRNLIVDHFDQRSHQAINTGTEGSICEPSDHGHRPMPAPPDRQVDFFSGAPAYHEVAMPTGEHLGKQPKGVALLVHGGGWSMVGTGAVHTIRARADEWRARGWSTVAVTSRGCAHWPEDLAWFHDAIRVISPKLPVCANGQSAGGHLSLLLAAQRPGLTCVVAEGAPTSLPALADGQAYDPSTGGTQNRGPKYVYNKAVAAFGADGLAAVDPLTHVGQIRAEVILASGERDHLVPLAQGEAMRSALDAAHPDRDHRFMVLAPGSSPFVHVPVSSSALTDLHAAVGELISL